VRWWETTTWAMSTALELCDDQKVPLQALDIRGPTYEYEIEGKDKSKCISSFNMMTMMICMGHMHSICIRAVLARCAVLCHACLLRACSVLCCAVLRCAVLFCSVLCCHVLYYAVLSSWYEHAWQQASRPLRRPTCLPCAVLRCAVLQWIDNYGQVLALCFILFLPGYDNG
jgi:hypothetical protein